MDDELGKRLELETATPEPAGIGEERSGGYARHVCKLVPPLLSGSRGGRRRRQAAGTGWEWDRAGSRGADTGQADRTAVNAAGRQAGQWGWGWLDKRRGWVSRADVMLSLPVVICAPRSSTDVNH